MRNLYLDVRGEPQEVALRLKNLSSQLENIQCSREIVASTEIAFSVQLADGDQVAYRQGELMGLDTPFLSFARADDLTGAEDALIARNLARACGANIRQGKGLTHITLPEIDCGIAIDNEGVIVECAGLRGDEVGQSATAFLAALIKQEIAVVIKRGDNFIYGFECASFEKTPKDPATGKNYFIGRDLMEFHGRAKAHGHVLPTLLYNLCAALASQHLDFLLVDLHGAGRYTDGKTVVRRFERDYVTALWEDDTFQGLIAYADVFFQNPSVAKSPFEGGEYLRVEGPGDFHRRFQLKR